MAGATAFGQFMIPICSDGTPPANHHSQNNSSRQNLKPISTHKRAGVYNPQGDLDAIDKDLPERGLGESTFGDLSDTSNPQLSQSTNR